MKTIEIPKDERYPDKNIPLITNEMKRECIGEFEWKEEVEFYTEDGDVEYVVITHTVPWDVCREIYKHMVRIASKETK